MNNGPTVYIVDDDPSVRDSLSWLLESENLATSIFASAEEFLDAYHHEWNGCITLDVRMPGMNGLELQEQLDQRGNSLPIIIITAHADVPMAIRAMKAGAFDFIEKPFLDEQLLNCLRRAIKAGGRARREQDQRLEIEQRYATLTPRERQVMQMVVAGKANKVIAADLELSSKTIEAHRSRIMSKMKARSLSALVRMAMMIEPV
ncbi:MAG: response regulator FixJ [Gammaproteobacteria bacterium]|nr:MAG: response regulator FixJ [Gammaproteobacteria bacterium]